MRLSSACVTYIDHLVEQSPTKTAYEIHLPTKYSVLSRSLAASQANGVLLCNLYDTEKSGRGDTRSGGRRRRNVRKTS